MVSWGAQGVQDFSVPGLVILKFQTVFMLKELNKYTLVNYK